MIDRSAQVASLNWNALTRLGRISLAGVAASAVLALALGVFIPSVVRRHALAARLDAAGLLVEVLEGEGPLPSIGEPLRGGVYRSFDRVVDHALLGGENVRVRLWNDSGDLVYSDQGPVRGVDRPPPAHLRSALGGEASADMDDVLRFYVPLQETTGEVVGAFEIRQDVAPLAAHLDVIGKWVRISVGSGLLLLLIFLISLFAATASVIAMGKKRAEERARELQTLLETASILGEKPALEETGRRVLDVLSRHLELGCAAIHIDGRQGAGPVIIKEDRSGLCDLCADAGSEAARSQEAVVRRCSEEPVASSCVAIAIPFAAPDIQGAVTGCRAAMRPFDASETRLLGAVASQVAVAAESSKLFNDLMLSLDLRRGLLRRMVTAQEDERRHIVGELHDGLAQKLTRLLYGLRGASQRLTGKDELVAAELVHLENLVDEEATGLRRYMTEIRPASLDGSGLPAAIESLAREQEAESGTSILVEADALAEVDGPVGMVLYRAVQEAVMNVRKHALASTIRIAARRRDGSLLLDISDDGRGREDLREGTGLSYLRDRIASIDGLVSVTSDPEAGTMIAIRVPLEEPS